MSAPVLVRPEALPSEFEARVVAAKYGDLRAYAKAVHNIEIEAYQEAWEEALNSLNRTIIICPPDTYKDLDIETPIPTPNGWRRMGDLKVGDTVFNEHGEPCEILGVSETFYGNSCYE